MKSSQFPLKLPFGMHSLPLGKHEFAFGEPVDKRVGKISLGSGKTSLPFPLGAQEKRATMTETSSKGISLRQERFASWKLSL